MFRRALAAGVVALSLGASASAGTGTVPTLQPGVEVHLDGTRLYCGVRVESSGPLLTCLVVKKGTMSPEGYAVGVSDGLVGATHFVGGSAPAVFVRTQPSVHLAPVAGAGKGSGIVTLKLGRQALVGGSHVILSAGRDPEHEPALAAGILDAKGNPLDGSYTIGISEHRAVVLAWKAGASKIVYQHAEPSS